MERQSLNGRWQMRRVGDPVFSEAIVPGSVYTDLLRNGQMEDPFFKDNELKALRLMDEDYEYVTSFDCTKSVYRSDRKVLRFDGIDTIADVYLNGEMIGSPDNMHRTWEYDVTASHRISFTEQIHRRGVSGEQNAWQRRCDGWFCKYP